MEFGAQALLSFNMEKGRMKINFDFTVAEKQSGGGGVWILSCGCPVPAVVTGHGHVSQGKEVSGT